MMKSIVESLFGVYDNPALINETLVYEYDALGDISGVNIMNTIASGVAGVNWEYVFCIALFAVVLMCFFKIIGGILKCKV